MPAWRIEPGGVRLFLRVTPNASANRIDGSEQRDDGTTVLRLRVTAPPDKGKANAAVIALLARSLGISRSAITLLAGDTARLKTLRIAGGSDSLAAALAKLG